MNDASKLYMFYPLQNDITPVIPESLSKVCKLTNQVYSNGTGGCHCGFCVDRCLESSVCCFYVKQSAAPFSKNWNAFLDDNQLCFAENPKVLSIISNIQELEHFICLEKMSIEDLAARRNDVFKNAYRSPSEDPNAALRFACYRKLTKLVHGVSAKGVRVPLPSCVVSLIQKTYPSLNGVYVGFENFENLDVE